ncbi:unnamed protein product [Thelazia callipaeda]|uniref:Uncharacterized protein n=1 Tax=Thelazia callipaeda TaxID=103827 RepID=A0A0N5D8E9_THECL|nr:unnamed protein product [Thelazia callipaeda]
MDSTLRRPSCSELHDFQSQTIAASGSVSNETLSPVCQLYRRKKFYLQQNYDYIYMFNNRLRNRLYHVKKEINYLKRLKRILCQRLYTFRDPFMDSCLEIPDNDPLTPPMEKFSGESAGKPSSNLKKKKAAEVKRVNQQASEVSSMAELAKNSVISIIDSVITESHEERVRATQNFGNQQISLHNSGLTNLNGATHNITRPEDVSQVYRLY